ncbi:MAG: hypothetical protein M3Q89_15060, partial [Verrucomicrobiota bacterium]|nr:hypothetical protein [Verrucomicrobiota bacterium]
AELANLSAQFSTGEDRERDNQFAAMFAELEKAGERGEFSATRQAAFRGILQRFQSLVREPAKTMDQKVSRLERMRAQISENKHIFTEAKSHQGRAARIEQAFAAMRSFLMDEMNQSHLTETERTAAFELYGDAGKARTELARVQKYDASVLDLEHDWLRPLAYRVRRFGLRHHLTLAEPLWGWSDVEVNPNAIFFAGSDELREKVDAVCRERRLQLAQDSVGWGAGQVRWNRLRESAIGVFDLTRSSAGEHASVCHALGSALALGVYPVVVTHTAGELPFDIDLPPVPLEAEPEEALRRSLDAALFGRYSTAGGGALDQTARQVLKRVPKKDATASPLRKRLAEKQPLDPIDAEKMFDYLLRNARGKAALLFPAWRPFYPGGKARRCFHVMPFSQGWSNEAREEVRQACVAAKVSYRRGDETGEMQIVHSIWEEICRATHVVIDLTGLNANVCLELALAQALGRKTLLVRRDEWTVENLFPEISKLQVLPYADASNALSLADLVDDFLAT